MDLQKNFSKLKKNLTATSGKSMVLQLVFTPNLTNYHTLVFGLYCHSQTEVQYLAQNETGKEAAVWQVIFSVKY